MLHVVDVVDYGRNLRVCEESYVAVICGGQVLDRASTVATPDRLYKLRPQVFAICLFSSQVVLLQHFSSVLVVGEAL